MKKIILISCMLLAVLTSVQSQLYTPLSRTVGSNTGNGLALDTVTNTAVKHMAIGAPGVAASITIQVNVTKISGTLGGTIIPVASNDGVSYYANGSGTFTVTDVPSQGINFSVPVGWRYYGVRWTGTGTMSGSVSAKLQKY
jgi:hypothetical protein